MRLGYNTNGFPHHRLEDAISILAELGYQSVAITLDHYALNPFDSNLPVETARIRQLVERLGLHCVIETGARFLLNPRRKHQPTLLSPNESERGRRCDFLRRAIDIAAELRADAVSFWSGAATSDEPIETLWERLRESCNRLVEYADSKAVKLAFEPEPGMFIDNMTKGYLLHQDIDHPLFGFTVDIGHLHCMGETPISTSLRLLSQWVSNIHIEDMRRGVHEHLMFGEGEIDFPPIFRTLKEIGYAGGLHVELSRHGHNAVEAATQAMAFLLRQSEIVVASSSLTAPLGN